MPTDYDAVRKEDSSITPPPVSQEAAPSRPPQMPPISNAADPSQRQAQEEYLRSLLRAPDAQEEQAGQPEDPMMKMFESILGGAGANEDAPGGLPFSPDDISKATGLPPFLVNTFLGGQQAPLTPAEEKTARMWTAVHLLFAFIAGIYLLFILNRSIITFGINPPAPATIQNPFLVFATGELLIEGSKMASMGGSWKGGFGMWLQLLKDIARDGCVVVFMMGAATYWKGVT